MNQLQYTLGLEEETQEYHRAFMLRRLAQFFIICDRRISMRQLAAEVEVSPEYISLYFQGKTSRRHLSINWDPENTDRSAGREALEERVEQGIEKLSADKGFVVPPLTDERYIQEQVVIPDLMVRPHR